MNDLNSINPESSILFLGAGFSTEAKNIQRKPLPSGSQLKKTFSEIVGVDEHDYNFQTLADEVSSQIDLYQLLYDSFTVSELSPAQIDILEQPWLRIYTTNYDDAVERACLQLRRDCHTYSYDEPKPRKIPAGAIIHLHGSIRQATRENVLRQLVLNEGSYIRQHFESSVWYEEFARDVRFSTNCFFLGYSLSDYHISALLHPVSGIREKTYFISRKPDAVFERRVRDFGQLLPIGLDGFANRCKELPRGVRLQNPFLLKSFRCFDPFKDKKTLSPPTPVEVLNLVTYGAFNEQRCIASLPGNTYVVPRNENVNRAVELLKFARTLVVHSRLGNGKSIFLSILAFKLSELGYKCFWCNEVSPTLSQELSALSSLEKVVVLFDSYDVALEVIRAISASLDSAKFVIAIRTGIQDVRLHEIQERLPSPLERINLNGLTGSEREDFLSLLDEAGILEKSLRTDLFKCDDIREVVTSVYRHNGIQQKLARELEPIMADAGLRAAMVSIHLLNIAGLQPNSAFLRAVSGGDAYTLASRFREVASEIVRFEDDELKAHSPIFSEYLSEHFFRNEDVIDIVFAMITEGLLRKPQRSYQAITSYFMQVSNLKRLIKGADQGALLAGLFDRLHRDVYVNAEPLFWLQYSILMMDLGEFPAAERFLDTAYDRAAALPGFKTFQLDTHALRILLVLETCDDGSGPVVRFEKILAQLNNVASILGEVSHRPFALRALKELEAFVNARISAIGVSECNALIIYIDRLVNILLAVPSGEETYMESQEALIKLRSAKAIILKVAVR